MKKHLLITPVIGLALALTACGGGGSDSTDTNVSVKPQLFEGETTLYRYGFDRKENEPDFSLNKREIVLDDGILHTRYKTEAPRFELFYLLTQDGLYEPETQQSYNASKGVRQSFTKSITDSKWVVTPYNKAGLKDLENTIKYEVVHLKSKSIAKVVEPYGAAVAEINHYNEQDYDYSYLPIRVFINKDTFSANAKCLRLVSDTYNQIALSFDPADSDTEIKNAKTLQDWADIQFKAGITLTSQPELYNWAGYRWGALDKKEQGTDGKRQTILAIEYKGKVYIAYGVSGTYTYQDYLNNLRDSMKNNKEEPSLIELTLANYKNTCTHYNKAAADDIETAVKKAMQ
jgi:hypothetical protein